MRQGSEANLSYGVHIARSFYLVSHSTTFTPSYSYTRLLSSTILVGLQRSRTSIVRIAQSPYKQYWSCVSKESFVDQTARSLLSLLPLVGSISDSELKLFLPSIHRQSRRLMGDRLYTRHPNSLDIPRATNILRRITTHKHQVRPHSHFNPSTIM